MLLDHFTLEEFKDLVPRLKKLNSDIKIVISGDIDEENIKKYAHYADAIMTSAPYYAKPLGFTSRIKALALDRT